MASLLQTSKSLERLAVKCLRSSKVNLRAASLYTATNEPMLEFAAGSQERKDIAEALKKYEGNVVDVPIVIGDEEIRTNKVQKQVVPFDHQRTLATFYYATPDIIQKAIDVSLKARVDWERRPLQERCDIFLRAADLMSKKYRMDLIATTMLGQAKNVFQAEIDAAAELIDFLRFDVQFAQGFWAAVCPFNFTAIGAHLPIAPAIMGNVSLWKPSDTAVLSNYVAFKIYQEAGLPPGVINFLPADGPVFGDTVLNSPDLAGLNFTGSVGTFKRLWKQTAQNLDVYKSYPRMIGECGGKNMHFVHPSANVHSVAYNTIRASFEYNGQKCSACSRAYVPNSIWPELKAKLIDVSKQVKMGSPLEYDSLVTAVIDDKAFARIKAYIDHAKSSPNMTIIAGGNYDDSKGYFIEPTIIETKDPLDKTMQEEIFGPVVTIHPYADEKMAETAEMAKSTSPFGLTCAIFAEDKEARDQLAETFRYSAGNLYINDKSTGSIVGQQPFGGARLSGTNDKAGGPLYMARFTSPMSIKETFVPLQTWKYPSLETDGKD